MRHLKYALAGLVGLALTTSALAQVGQGTQTWWNGSRSDAAVIVGTSKTSAATITITVPSGQYFYLTGYDVVNCATGTAVTPAAPTDITSTNMSGITLTVGSGVTAGLCQPSPVSNLGPGGLKSGAPGTNVTFVLPTFATNQIVRASFYGYFAP